MLIFVCVVYNHLIVHLPARLVAFGGNKADYVVLISWQFLVVTWEDLSPRVYILDAHGIVCMTPHSFMFVVGLC